MKNQLLLSVFLFIVQLVYAQPPAQDFTITDPDGNTHTLYADYLDQGKTVVIKFFFTYCPPCNAMAPLMEPFYQDWGGGMYDMEMISLSIFNNDNNPAVANYKQMHGHTWPGAGGDGGGYDAALPYLNDTWGDFMSTPTFAVIAPDGTVIFNPKGPNFEATLDSVEAAILSTGAVKPFAPINSGGQVHTFQNVGIPNIQVGISPVDSSLDITDTNGNFNVESTINVFENNALVFQKSDTHTNGLNVADIIRIQQDILAVNPFQSPYEELAADVNRDGAVNLLDILELIKAILTVGADFENQPAWLFLDANYLFENPDSPAQEIYQEGKGKAIVDPNDSTNFDIIGIKIGDVNGSASLN